MHYHGHTLGDGKLLFDHLRGAPIELERTHVVEAPEGVTHPRLRIKETA